LGEFLTHLAGETTLPTASGRAGHTTHLGK
jgi:hypothetical protein